MYNPYEKWEERDMPSPISLMKVVKGTDVSAQDMYYSMMSMRIADFDRANTAVLAMNAIRKGGLESYGDIPENIDDACHAILSKDLGESFSRAIKSMENTLTYIGGAMAKSEDKDKDKDKDKDDEEEPEDDREPKEEEPKEEPKEEADVEESMDGPNDFIEASEGPAEAPVAVEEVGEAPGIDIRVLMAGPAQTMAIDPELIMKALKMLQSIGSMC